ncbi:peptidoglycan DD-metalloendopeptidase family protein, partial [candidate division KSB1 bacterium]
DSLSIYFPADNIYSNFDNEETHYPAIDFSNKTDTTLLILADNNTYSYYHPFCGRVTSKFGKRRYRYHFGIDVDLVTGDTLYCAFDGMVRITKISPSYGHVVVVRHLNGLETLYAHLSKILVDTDQLLKAGDVIGLGGNTGRSYGSHLHFEIRYLGAPINPQDIIDFDHCCLKRDSLFLSGYNFRYLAEIKELKKAKYHRIRSGDTLSRLAGKYHTSISRLCALNGISRNTILRIGRSLRVR